MKNAPSIGIIGLSALLILGALIFSVGLFTQFGQANLFDDLNTSEDSIVPLSYETRMKKGDSLFQGGYYTLAASEYALAITIQEENPEAYIKLGDTHMMLKDYEKASEQYRRALEFKGDDADLIANYAHALIRTGAFNDAQMILEASSHNQSGLFYLGMLKAYYGEHDAAQDLFNDATEGNAVDPSHLQGFLDAYATHASQTEGQNVYLKALLAEAMVDAGEHQLAEALSWEILADKSDYRDVWMILGYAQLQTEQYQAAEESFGQAKRLDSIKAEIHYFLGTAHYFQEEYNEAIDAYELALLYDFEPQSEAYRKMAESHLFLDNHEAALDAYEYLVKIDASSVDVFVRPLWIAVDVLGDLGRAQTLAEEAVTFFPGEAMSHNLLGWVYLEKGDFALAEDELNLALEIDGDLAEAHYNKGQLREAQGNTEDAKSAYKKAYELAESGDNISSLAAEKYNALVLNQDE